MEHEDLHVNESASTGGAPPWLRDAVRRLESDDRWDPVADSLSDAAQPLTVGATGSALRGEWLGHALHPLMTDLPIGCWTSSMVLDVIGGKRSRRASRRLVGLGVLLALPTAATGVVELATIEDRRIRRVAAVHALGNTAALAVFAASYLARRHQHQFRGVALGVAGGALATVTGYLGGHMSFARSAGVQDRGIDHSLGAAQPSDSSAVADLRTGTEVRGTGSSDLLGVEQAAHELTMAVEQVHTLVDEGILPTAQDDPPRFRREDVEAVRLMGG